MFNSFHQHFEKETLAKCINHLEMCHIKSNKSVLSNLHRKVFVRVTAELVKFNSMMCVSLVDHHISLQHKTKYVKFH